MSAVLISFIMKRLFFFGLIAISLLIIILVFGFRSSPAHFHDDFKLQSQQVERQYNTQDICHHLDQQMQAIDNKRTVLALEQMNNNLRLCLPFMSPEQQIKMLHYSTEMYQNFVQVSRNKLQQQTFEYLAKISDPMILQQHPRFTELHPRDQYLMTYQGQLFIDLVESTKGHLYYLRTPDYLINHFSAYLPISNPLFIQRVRSSSKVTLAQHQI